LQLCIETESDAYTTGRMFIAHKSHWGQVGEYLSEQIKHSDKMLDRSVYKPYTAVILVNTTYDSMSVSFISTNTNEYINKFGSYAVRQLVLQWDKLTVCQVF